MCGLTGLLHPGLPEAALKTKVSAMMRTLAHRGPDDEGVFVAPEGLCLGHKRLAIIDPVHGKQPMSVEGGAVTVVFNGAIYNYQELRRELIGNGHQIHSYSDTEVLLHAYLEWGESCVERFLGMFAFALWDAREEKLFCVRDRIGIKPFYYRFDGVSLHFASEIKAILTDELVERIPSPEALQDYLTFQFCLGDKTLFQGIHKLEPGHSMTLAVVNGQLRLSVKQYWDVEYNIDEEHDESWFVDNLGMLLEDSARLHLRSDVPFGAHLSGGLDSSTVVCLTANMLRGERLKTFTGAFPEGPKFDETEYAKQVSAEAGTEYHEIYIHGDDLSTLLPKLMYYMDEPVAGPGVIPQYHVSRLAAKHVKVVLGGQGGDEIFIGYARYLVAYLEKCLSGAIDQTANTYRYAVSLESIAPNLSLLQTYRPMLQQFWSKGLFDSRDKRYFRLVDRREGMRGLFAQDFGNPAYSSFESFQEIFNRKDLHSFINQMTYFDLKASLPALLHVEDRTSMAASIESRVPLLDHRIVEFMARIPPNTKFAGGRMKHLFKEAVRNVVPQAIFNRKDKMGFPTPLAQWIKGPVRDFVFDTLLSGKARQRGLFNMKEIERVLNNEREFGRVVWGLLCLELWHRVYMDGEYDHEFNI